jgi:hypothetical protein
LKTPPAPSLALLLLALTLALTACGGGSTAGPVAATENATTSPAPATPSATRTAPPQATTPPTTRSAARRPAASAPSPAPQAGARRPQQGGAAVPDADGRDAASPGSSAAVSEDSSPAPAVPSPPSERHAAAAPDPQPAGSLLDETAELTLVERISPAHYIQQGTVTGTYDGTMEVEARITSKGVLVRFTATLPGGTISGKGVAIAILDSTTWPGLRGTAAVTGGTGRFADIRGRKLKVTGRARPDASKARVRLAGTVTY